MGFNFAVRGFTAVEDFYKATQISGGEHLNAFRGRIRGNSPDDDPRERRPPPPAARYDGPDYKKNKYDEKLAAAYAKYK